MESRHYRRLGKVYVSFRLPWNDDKLVLKWNLTDGKLEYLDMPLVSCVSGSFLYRVLNAFERLAGNDDIYWGKMYSAGRWSSLCLGRYDMKKHVVSMYPFFCKNEKEGYGDYYNYGVVNVVYSNGGLRALKCPEGLLYYRSRQGGGLRSVYVKIGSREVYTARGLRRVEWEYLGKAGDVFPEDVRKEIEEINLDLFLEDLEDGKGGV